MNERSREWKRRDRARRRVERDQVKADPNRRCGRGHLWHGNRTPKGDDCILCTRERAEEAAARKRGGPPRVVDPQVRACGHPRTDQRRGKPSDCGTCHREAQKRRYHADPVRHRQAAIDWQRANPETAAARLRNWKARNPDRVRELELARRYSPDEETLEWLMIIQGDPCAYCGAPSEAVDHVLAVSRDGVNHWSNFAPACRACNSSKRDRPLLAWMLSRRAEVA